MPNSFPLLQRIHHRASSDQNSLAIIDTCSSPTKEYTYPHLFHSICEFSTQIEKSISDSTTDLENTRVGIISEKGYPLVVALLATYTAGGIAIPLLPSLPLAEHAYMVENAGCGLLICDGKNESRGKDLLKGLPEGSCKVILIPNFPNDAEKKEDSITSVVLPDITTFPILSDDRKAMMLFTSGTTGRPKGVITRHSALTSQLSSISLCWKWTSNDLLLHVLPMNHLHGITVGLLTGLWSGGGSELWSKFDGEKVWKRWMNEQGKERGVTMFFGVPTVYARLLHSHSLLPTNIQSLASHSSSLLRLQVSGSAPLPTHIKSAWDNSVGGEGQVLVERYGMTETGIVMSTGMENERRVAGHVGYPLPGMEVRLWNNETNTLINTPSSPGEIQVRGASIFNEYWNLPEATAAEFTTAGNDVDADQEGGAWFKTGDVGIQSEEYEGMYKILGRQSVDIIKSGGEKLSAVDIERALLELDYITDAAVMGIPNEDWGQVVGAVVVSSEKDLKLEKVRKDLREKLAAYKLPRAIKVYTEIPRNAMGKIQKKTLVVEAFGSQA